MTGGERIFFGKETWIQVIVCLHAHPSYYIGLLSLREQVSPINDDGEFICLLLKDSLKSHMYPSFY